MPLLSNILRYKPTEWAYADYDDSVFVRIEVQPSSSEYARIRSAFRQKFNNAAVISIERVQHPFAYGRYCIRREQLKAKTGRQPQEKRLFLTITDPRKIDDILEYNCDNRRGGFSNASYINGNGYVLAIKSFGSNYDERDTHRYPEYIIRYRCTNNVDDDFYDHFDRLRIY